MWDSVEFWEWLRRCRAGTIDSLNDARGLWLFRTPSVVRIRLKTTEIRVRNETQIDTVAGDRSSCWARSSSTPTRTARANGRPEARIDTPRQKVEPDESESRQETPQARDAHPARAESSVPECARAAIQEPQVLPPLEFAPTGAPTAALRFTPLLKHSEYLAIIDVQCFTVVAIPVKLETLRL